jgi:hypothetical protein
MTIDRLGTRHEVDIAIHSFLFFFSTPMVNDYRYYVL